MAVVVGETVEHYDAVWCSPEDEVFLVVLRTVVVMTHKAWDAVVGQGLDVFHPPWSPEIFTLHGFTPNPEV